MAKKESTITNMVITLFLVTFIAAASLGFVYELTKGPIKKAMVAKKNVAIKKVLPEYTNSPVSHASRKYVDGDTIYKYFALDGTDTVGVAVETFTNEGFSGNISIMVGFLPDGTIHNTFVLQHKETPGLGDKMAKPEFKGQFRNKKPGNFKLKVKKDGGDVDAITASTITSRAFCDAVERAYNQLNLENRNEPTE